MTDDIIPAAPEAEPDEEFVTPIPVLEPDDVPEITKPPFMVVSSTFIAQSEVGELRFQLQFKTKLIRNMPKGFSDDLDMLFYLFASQPKLLETLDDLDIVDSRVIASKFFQAFTERQDLRLGESKRSSRS